MQRDIKIVNLGGKPIDTEKVCRDCGEELEADYYYGEEKNGKRKICYNCLHKIIDKFRESFGILVGPGTGTCRYVVCINIDNLERLIADATLKPQT